MGGLHSQSKQVKLVFKSNVNSQRRIRKNITWVKNNLSKTMGSSKWVGFITLCGGYIISPIAVFRELMELVYWFGRSENEPRKLSSTLPKSCFCQTDNKLITFAWNVSILDAYLWIKHSVAKEEQRDFMKKKNMQQLPKPQCIFLSNIQELTIRNYLDPVWFKAIDFNYVKKKKIKTSKNPSFPLTWPGNSKTRLSVTWEPGLYWL